MTVTDLAARCEAAELMYRVCWEHKITGKRDCGGLMTLATATAWVAELSNIYPELRHWVQHGPDKEKPPTR